MVPQRPRRSECLYARRVLVAIDVGNSEVKLALVRDGRILTLRRRPTRTATGAYDAEDLLAQATGTDAPGGVASRVHGIEALVLVSVVPAWTESVVDLAARLALPLVIADHSTIPLKSRLPRTDRVGADRLLDAFAAMRLHGTPTVVVDLGTATTIDAVDASGAFAGGAIAPGLELGLAALAGGTARLPRVAIETPERALGRDTIEAIQSGTVLGHVGVVRELTARISAELGTGTTLRPTVVVTGGLSALPWVALLDADVIDPQLTLKGLALLHAEIGAAVVP